MLLPFKLLPAKLKDKLRFFPFYPFLIPAFFLLHGYARFLDLIPVPDLIIYYFAAGAVILIGLLLVKYYLGSFSKAAVIIGFVSLLYFFFGDIQLAILALPGLANLGRYMYLLTTYLIIVILMFFALKRSKWAFDKLTSYLNVLFLILCLYDMVFVLGSVMTNPQDKPKLSENSVNCDTCKTPDIYLIVLDGYAGMKTLQTRFKYKNAEFTEFFRSRSFYTPATPKSNYSSTAISIASLLTMDTLPWAVRDRKFASELHARAEKNMDSSLVLKLLKEHQYKFLNHSIFNIDDQPSQYDPGLLPTKLKLITAQTFANKSKKDLFGSIQVGLGARFEWAERYHENALRSGNKRLMDLTLTSISTKSIHPKFVYTHLLMPHAPYLYDSLGREVNNKAFKKLTEGEEDSLYLSYLVYTNKIVTRFVDKVIYATEGKAVVLVMSDHGYRQIKNYDIEKFNDNFSTIYIPGGDYRLYYDSVSNMNQFRLLFNTLFHSNLKLLPDKSYF